MGCERQGQDIIRVAREAGPLVPCGHVPELDGAVFAGRGQGPAVGVDREGEHPAGVPRPDGLRPARGHVPEPHASVVTP